MLTHLGWLHDPHAALQAGTALPERQASGHSGPLSSLSSCVVQWGAACPAAFRIPWSTELGLAHPTSHMCGSLFPEWVWCPDLPRVPLSATIFLWLPGSILASLISPSLCRWRLWEGGSCAADHPGGLNSYLLPPELGHSPPSCPSARAQATWSQSRVSPAQLKSVVRISSQRDPQRD